MPYLEIYRNEDFDNYNYTVLKGNDLYQMRLIAGEKMQYKYLGKVDRNTFRYPGTLVKNPPMKMIYIIQKALVHESSFSSFKDWLFESHTHKVEYGCVMLFATLDDWPKHLERIKKEDIYDDENHNYGLEKEPHCTLFYGLHLNTVKPEDVKEFIKTLSPVYVTINSIHIFENEEYDVVKYDVPKNDNALQTYHDMIKKAFPNTETYAEYYPHMTLAYVEKGKGKKYVGKVKPFKVKFDKAVYSFDGKDGNREKISVKLKE